jgi:hypothetical protein
MRFRVAAVVLLLCGCVSTRHVEYHRTASTHVDSGGQFSASSDASQDERRWQGPWPAQPDRLRP